MSKDSGSSAPSSVGRACPMWSVSRRVGAGVVVSFWLSDAARCRARGGGRLAPWRSPWLGLAVGALVGAVLGTVASVLLWVWPLLRAVWHWLARAAPSPAVVGGRGDGLAPRLGSWWWSLLLLAPVAVRGGDRGRCGGGWWRSCGARSTRHRLRVCFAAFIRARNRIDPGLAPLILLARPTPAGERVWVWLRTGLDVGRAGGPDGEDRGGVLGVGGAGDRLAPVRRPGPAGHHPPRPAHRPGRLAAGWAACRRSDRCRSRATRSTARVWTWSTSPRRRMADGSAMTAMSDDV